MEADFREFFLLFTASDQSRPPGATFVLGVLCNKFRPSLWIKEKFRHLVQSNQFILSLLVKDVLNKQLLFKLLFCNRVKELETFIDPHVNKWTRFFMFATQHTSF